MQSNPRSDGASVWKGAGRVKIERVEATELAIPFIERVREPMAAHMAGTERTFLYRLYSDDGLVGVGEGGDYRGLLDRYIGVEPLTLLMGSDPEPLQEALYDLVGKALGVPAHRLIGQKCRDRVEAAFWSIDMSPERAAAEAVAAVEAGYYVHKLKVRPWQDFIAQAEQIFAATPPEYRLRPDNNGHRYPDYFTVERMRQFARQLEPYMDRIDYFEGPIHDQDLSGLAHLRQRGLAISVHAGPEWASLCCQREASDFFQVGGPLDSLVKTAHVAEAAGHRGVCVELAGGGVGAGINTVWATHIAAVLPNATKAICTVPELRVASLLQNPLQAVNGAVAVPEAPGLGVELDEEVITRFRLSSTEI